MASSSPPASCRHCWARVAVRGLKPAGSCSVARRRRGDSVLSNCRGGAECNRQRLSEASGRSLRRLMSASSMLPAGAPLAGPAPQAGGGQSARSRSGNPSPVYRLQPPQQVAARSQARVSSAVHRRRSVQGRASSAAPARVGHRRTARATPGCRRPSGPATGRVPCCRTAPVYPRRARERPTVAWQGAGTARSRPMPAAGRSPAGGRHHAAARATAGGQHGLHPGPALQGEQCADPGQRGQCCCQRPLVEQECCKGREQRKAEQTAGITQAAQLAGLDRQHRGQQRATGVASGRTMPICQTMAPSMASTSSRRTGIGSTVRRDRAAVKIAASAITPASSGGSCSSSGNRASAALARSSCGRCGRAAPGSQSCGISASARRHRWWWLAPSPARTAGVQAATGCSGGPRARLHPPSAPIERCVLLGPAAPMRASRGLLRCRPVFRTRAPAGCRGVPSASRNAARRIARPVGAQLMQFLAAGVGTGMQRIAAALRQCRRQGFGQWVDQQRLFRPHPRPRPHQAQGLGRGQADTWKLQPAPAFAGNLQFHFTTAVCRQRGPGLAVAQLEMKAVPRTRIPQRGPRAGARVARPVPARRRSRRSVRRTTGDARQWHSRLPLPPAAGPAAGRDCCCSSARPAAWLPAGLQRTGRSGWAAHRCDGDPVASARLRLRGRASSCMRAQRVATFNPPRRSAGSRVPMPAPNWIRLPPPTGGRPRRRTASARPRAPHARDPAAVHVLWLHAAAPGRHAATGRRARLRAGGCGSAGPAHSRSARRWHAPFTASRNVRTWVSSSFGTARAIRSRRSLPRSSSRSAWALG